MEMESHCQGYLISVNPRRSLKIFLALQPSRIFRSAKLTHTHSHSTPTPHTHHSPHTPTPPHHNHHHPNPECSQWERKQVGCQLFDSEFLSMEGACHSHLRHKRKSHLFPQFHIPLSHIHTKQIAARAIYSHPSAVATACNGPIETDGMVTHTHTHAGLHVQAHTHTHTHTHAGLHVQAIFPLHFPILDCPSSRAARSRGQPLGARGPSEVIRLSWSGTGFVRS